MITLRMIATTPHLLGQKPAAPFGFRKYPHWDDATTKELIYEGWTHVTQKFINEKVASTPERLQAVKDGEGKMTGC